ncbi:molybdopterin dinucleotide binding domain-containing protein [Halanaerobium hydrogeniformans]|uniref:Molybdopterin dinucleotide-binding region n=1 Tax=Halanaerobium hydrogeniformans TaxID=656519 RepID=E4RM57_HALHG|nr:molybdopterin dinucleotide binding domain-containing protein [Halanaerobium hydrogeniformans]ADQ14388.1 molybdopterin dinucleotide-binding region [Halanaerobium hydrogeniformans]
MLENKSFTLITGRTIKQGMASVSGKKNEGYKKETAYVEISKKLLEEYEIKEDEKVILQSDSGKVEVRCKGADLSEKIVFMPYGETANKLIGTDTGGTGMPNSKSKIVKIMRKEEKAN